MSGEISQGHRRGLGRPAVGRWWNKEDGITEGAGQGAKPGAMSDTGEGKGDSTNEEALNGIRNQGG